MALPEWVGKLWGSPFMLPVIVLIIVTATIFFERIVRQIMHTIFEDASRHINVDHTQYAITKNFLSFLIYIIGFGFAIFIIPPLRTLSLSLFASAGVLAVIIGFAAQKTFSDVISGMFIAISKPFRVGDLIKFDQEIGTVEDISLRYTVLKSFENKRFIIPNSKITDGVIENYDLGDEKTCAFIEFPISYDSNIDKAIKIMTKEVKAHPDFIDIRTTTQIENKEPEVVIKVISIGDFAINLRAWAWAKTPRKSMFMHFDLNKSIKEAFDKNGIEIPFPYRTIVQKEGKVKKNKK